MLANGSTGETQTSTVVVSPCGLEAVLRLSAVPRQLEGARDDLLASVAVYFRQRLMARKTKL